MDFQAVIDELNEQAEYLPGNVNDPLLEANNADINLPQDESVAYVNLELAIPPAPEELRTGLNMTDVVAGTIGVVSTAPAVGILGIQAVGFSSGGIIGGSYAAGLMAAEAVASGGGIAAGGYVATLQSIGAIGVLGSGLAVGCLAFTTAAVGYGIYRIVKR